jgi:hypothetical protein
LILETLSMILLHEAQDGMDVPLFGKMYLPDMGKSPYLHAKGGGGLLIDKGV